MPPLRHLTWNLLDFGGPETLTPERRRDVLDVIREIDPDIFSLQEIMGPDRTTTFLELARDLAMDAHVPAEDGTLHPAFEPGNRRRGVGLLWRRDRLRPVVGSLRHYNAAAFWSGMVLARFSVDGAELVVASSHLPPRLPNWRKDELIYTALELTGAGPNGIIGADWNSFPASRRSNGEYYDADAYAPEPWQGRFVSRCSRDPHTGQHYADRGPMHALLDAGLIDPAAYIDAPWYRTVGYWNAHSISKRNDGPYVTPTVATTVESIFSWDMERCRRASDHLPVILDFDLSNLVAP